MAEGVLLDGSSCDEEVLLMAEGVLLLGGPPDGSSR